MHTTPPPTQPFDMTLRVGCSLAYEATGPASLLLNVQPWAGRNYQVVYQDITLGDHLPSQPFTDTHGNYVHRIALAPGPNYIRHDAIVAVQSLLDNEGLSPGIQGTGSDSSPDNQPTPETPAQLPAELLRYTLPSRYCDSDKLANFAWDKFGQIPHGHARVQAISHWLHHNLEYRYFSGSPELSAWDILQRGYGVCRDFAHLAVALNRTFNLPARYVTGHLPDIGFPDPDNHMDFHAYAEVYLNGHWHTTDPRFHVPRIGRIKIACGHDAVDGAFSTIFGGATLSYFEVWAYQVQRNTVAVGDPVDLTQRLDNQKIIHTEPAYTPNA